jgi:hypothetical protein
MIIQFYTPFTRHWRAGVLYKTPNTDCFRHYNKFPLLLQSFAGRLMLMDKGVISSIAVPLALKKHYIVKLRKKTSFFSVFKNPRLKRARISAALRWAPDKDQVDWVPRQRHARMGSRYSIYNLRFSIYDSKFNMANSPKCCFAARS